MEFTVEEIVALTKGVCRVKPDETRLLRSITWDSRDVTADGLFVALPGANVDGHDFIAAALERGAKAVLVMRPPTDSERVSVRNAGAAIIEVPDGPAAIRDLALGWRSRLRARVIGITGSSGKTTTKNFTASVLSRRWRVHATAGNQNNELGVPKTILDADGDCQVLIVELGVDAPGDMAPLTALVRPDWGVIVSIGASHLETLGDERTVAWEKTGLWRALPADGLAFLNRSDAWAESCYRFGGLDRVPFDLFGYASQSGAAFSMIGASRASGIAASGKGADRDLMFRQARRSALATDVTLDGWGRPSFTLELTKKSSCETLPVTLRLVGRHNVLDACAAAAVGAACGLEAAQIVEGLQSCEPSPGRARVIESARGFGIVDDAYNANPLSMKAALNSFAEVSVAGRRFAVIGDMGELGAAGEQSHQRIGELVATLPLDGVIFVGELSRIGAEAAAGAGFDARKIWTCDGAAEATDIISELVSVGDAVLVKASRFMGLDAVVEELA